MGTLGSIFGTLGGQKGTLDGDIGPLGGQKGTLDGSIGPLDGRPPRGGEQSELAPPACGPRALDEGARERSD
ncbi:hypothetical protein [Williamsia sp. 1135]|uniref:hypothetical protein n=1 Tax=Williamsia sp. 1135 TaxID=1889262 RepID=UPI000A1017EF|nr:hypothetical protein [Williamsia sp. 1135]ORM35859.1 hypothetical protein BFL43_08715 [Williamsia sp. 1135]